MEKQLNSETLFEGKIFTVHKDEVLCENGEKAYRECVYHHGGACILAIEDDEIILVKQYRYTLQREMIEIPAGKLEKDEDPREACFREFEEETSRRAKDMNFLCKIVPTPGYCSEEISLYEAIDFKEVEDSLDADPDEDLHLLKMPIDEAYKAIFEGKITDSKTVIAILYAYNRKHAS